MRSNFPVVYPRRAARRGLLVVHRVAPSPLAAWAPSSAAIHRVRVSRERRHAPGRQAAHRVPLRGRRSQRPDRSECVSGDGGRHRSHLSLPRHAHGVMGPARRQCGGGKPNAEFAPDGRPRVLDARGVWERIRAVEVRPRERMIDPPKATSSGRFAKPNEIQLLSGVERTARPGRRGDRTDSTGA